MKIPDFRSERMYELLNVWLYSLLIQLYIKIGSFCCNNLFFWKHNICFIFMCKPCYYNQKEIFISFYDQWSWALWSQSNRIVGSAGMAVNPPGKLGLVYFFSKLIWTNTANCINISKTWKDLVDLDSRTDKINCLFYAFGSIVCQNNRDWCPA